MDTSRSLSGARKRIARSADILARRTQRQTDGLDAAHSAHEPVSPFLTSDEACDYLRYKGRNRLRSLYKFIERTGIKTQRRGLRSLLLKRTDIDAAIGAR